MLKFEITKEAFEALEEAQQALYAEHGDGYRLQVDGIDPADELKEALRKEREERAEAKRKLQELETEAEKKERERLEAQQEYQTLYSTEKEARAKAEKERKEAQDELYNSKRMTVAESIVAPLIDRNVGNGAARYEDLREKAAKFISYTPEGVKINGPDGEAWDSKKLAEHLTEKYSWIVDGSRASGGGAPGSSGGGAVTKKFDQMSGAELSALRKEKPDEYQRLRDEYHSR